MLTHGPKMTHLPQTRTLTIYLMGYFIVLNYKKSLLSFQSYEDMSILGPNYSLAQTVMFAEKVTTYFDPPIVLFHCE